MHSASFHDSNRLLNLFPKMISTNVSDMPLRHAARARHVSHLCYLRICMPVSSALISAMFIFIFFMTGSLPVLNVVAEVGQLRTS